MSERATLKKTQRFNNENDFVAHFGPHPYTDEADDVDAEDSQLQEEEMNVEEFNNIANFIKKVVSDCVKEYCEEHFEEINAGAIMLHEAKKKRKMVKAASLKLQLEKSNK